MNYIERMEQEYIELTGRVEKLYKAIKTLEGLTADELGLMYAQYYKVGANYASTFKPYKIAHEQGYMELLYLNSSTHKLVDEFGSSNFFGIKGNKYVTPLSDSVLPSITNKSLQYLIVL